MTKPAPFAIISSLTGIVACVRSASFAALMAASGIAASTQIAAADITYFVDQTIAGASATGSVTGSITIAGQFLGPQFTSDITDFNLTISVNDQSSNLRLGVNGGTVGLGSGALTATPTELMYNFGITGGFANFFSTSSCQPIWTMRGAGGTACNGVSGIVNSIQAVSGGPIAMVPGSGLVTIAVVPGPIVGAGLPGAIAALGGLVAMARRRRKQLA